MIKWHGSPSICNFQRVIISKRCRINYVLLLRKTGPADAHLPTGHSRRAEYQGCQIRFFKLLSFGKSFSRKLLPSSPILFQSEMGTKFKPSPSFGNSSLYNLEIKLYYSHIGGKRCWQITDFTWKIYSGLLLSKGGSPESNLRVQYSLITQEIVQCQVVQWTHLNSTWELDAFASAICVWDRGCLLNTSNKIKIHLSI